VDSYLAAGLSPDRIELVPNGIDTDRFVPADADQRRVLRDRLRLPQDRRVILFVGFFSRDKQPRVLFDAWLRLRATTGLDATLLFVGATRSPYFEVDDDLADALGAEALARGVGDRVVFAGATHDPQDYFRAADVFALTSRREGLPVALLEAMACGLPCVASRLAGSTDGIIDDGRNGLLVPAEDVTGFAESLGRVLQDHALAMRLGNAARETILRRFANLDTADRWLSAYERLAKGRAST
jgi:glycosyltransferase involved in cell wall biosynthesis